MPSAQEDERAFFFDEDDDDSEFNSDEEYDDEFGQIVAPPPREPSAAGKVTGSSDLPPNLNPNPNLPQPPSSDSAAGILTPSSHQKRQRAAASAAASEETRRIFQKLWTDEDEITILAGFLEFTTQRGTTYSDYQYDTGPFFDQIRPRLQFEFNKNQLVEKLRRLKRKYRNAVTRIAAGKESVFKNPHDRATFEISRNIWSSSFKRARKRRADRTPNTQSNELHADTNVISVLGSDTNATESQWELRPRSAEEAAVEVTVKDSAVPPVICTVASSASIVDETLRSCLSPLFKELLNYAISGSFGAGGIASGGMTLNPLQLNLPASGAAADERWKQQQILELEVFLKRTELVQEQIKSALEKLRSAGTN